MNRKNDRSVEWPWMQKSRAVDPERGFSIGPCVPILMRTLPLLLCLALCAAAKGAPRKIAYEQNGNIFVADLDGGNPKKIATGALPALSPDGRHVAFNTEADAKKRSGPERRIAVADIASRKTTILKEIPSDNCFGPVWSADGNQLLFMIMADQKWQLGIVRPDGSGFRFLKNPELNSEGLGGQEWSRDGRSIFCHDLENIYQVDLDGKTVNKWSLSKILIGASMNSGDRLSISADGRTLLLDVDCDAEHERKNWDGPQPAIEKFDLAGDKAIRVTGKDDFIWEPFWLGENEFLCVMQKENEKEPSIYRMSIDGKISKLLVKHARTPSASAP